MAAKPKAAIHWHKHGVEVFDEHGEFVGALTRERVQSTQMMEVAHIEAEILKNLGFDVTVERDD